MFNPYHLKDDKVGGNKLAKSSLMKISFCRELHLAGTILKLISSNMLNIMHKEHNYRMAL